MNPKETNASISFVAKLVEGVENNHFTNLPVTLKEFLERNDGVMQGITDQLYPDQLYEISISIKSVTDSAIKQIKLTDDKIKNKSTESFFTMIKNGWLNTPKESIDKIYKEINNLILNKKKESEVIRICHAEYVKKYIKETIGGGVDIQIINNYVCAEVKVIINIEYYKLSDSDYFNLTEMIKKGINENSEAPFI